MTLQTNDIHTLLLREIDAVLPEKLTIMGSYRGGVNQKRQVKQQRLKDIGFIGEGLACKRNGARYEVRGMRKKGYFC